MRGPIIFVSFVVAKARGGLSSAFVSLSVLLWADPSNSCFFFALLCQQDADLALARVLQEQERELYFSAQQSSFRSGSDHGLAFQERSLNSIQDDNSDGSDLNDEQFAARLQAQELSHRFYTDPNGEPIEFPENAPQEIKNEEIPEDFTYEDLSTLGDAAGTVKVGLSKDKLNVLKKIKYSSTNGEIQDEKCAICQIEFEEEETILLLPCKHVYHESCINPWLADNKNCPICKHELEE